MKRFEFQSKARKIGRGIPDGEIVAEIGVWTDGIGLFSEDVGEYVAYRLKPGKTYRVTVEEVC